ncbi:hypothetical protein ARMGADRAFT_1038028 [Armillaria gallica]|uniref:Uncharacterized protein n=1 Tax=Armillaria gallica TaxID=47427 RepID=A0A2H3CJH0_ARMGA|nr:hypothetical protein ARMGADRAFT_1038028 [Armillaria gallica]
MTPELYGCQHACCFRLHPIPAQANHNTKALASAIGLKSPSMDHIPPSLQPMIYPEDLLSMVEMTWHSDGPLFTINGDDDITFNTADIHSMLKVSGTYSNLIESHKTFELAA